jgi:hypothetical protein
MKETISIPVVTTEDDMVLTFELEENIISLQLNGREICRADWENNMKNAVWRMLEMWQ